MLTGVDVPEAAIQPFASVTLMVSVPPPSIPTTHLVVLAPATAVPFLNHWYSAPVGFGETAAVKVVVRPGNKFLTGAALIVTIGNGLTVSTPAVEVLEPEQPAAVIITL